jgi:hypothetical protein
MAAPLPVPPIADADRYVSYQPTSSTSVFPIPFPVFGDGSDLAVYYNGVPTGAYSFSSASGVPVAAIALPIIDGEITLGPISSGTLEIFGDWRPRQGILDTSPSITRREYQQDLGQVVASLREAWTAILATYPLSKVARANGYLAFDANGNPTSVQAAVANTFFGFDAQGNPYAADSVVPVSITVSSAMAPVIAAADYATALGIMGFSTFFLTLIGASDAASFYAAIGGTSFGGSLAAAANAGAALTTLGVSAFMQTVLPAANAAAALTTLGLTTFGQSLVGAANAAAALTTLGFSSLTQSLVTQSTAAAYKNVLGGASTKRQTVVGGPIDASGLPNFLPTTSASLALTSQLITSSTPLVVTAAAGAASGGTGDLIGLTTTNLTWSPLQPSTTTYLYIKVNADGTLTPGSTTLPPIHQWGAAPSTVNGQFTFNICETKGYLGNGSAAPQTTIVFIGEVVTSASAVTSTVAYAYNGVYLSPLIAVPAASSQTLVTHNVGYLPQNYEVELTFVAIAANAGLYPIGAEVNAGPAWAGGGHGALSAIDRHVVALSTSNSMSLQIPPYAGGAPVAMVNTNWNLRLLVQRSF